MSFLTDFLIVVLFLSILLLVLLRRGVIQGIPGPFIYEYLPGGIACPILQDVQAFKRTLLHLSETYGDIYQFRVGLSNVLASANCEDIIHILTSPNFSRGSEIFAVFETFSPGGLFVMPNDIHCRTRKAIRDTFNHPMLESFHDKMVEAVDEFCDQLNHRTQLLEPEQYSEPIDIAVQVAATTLSAIMNIAFGFDSTRQQRLQIVELSDQVLDEMMKDFIGYPLRHALEMFGTRTKFQNVRAKMAGICASFIDKRIAETKAEHGERTKDVLDTILSMYKTDLPTAVSLVVEFTIAGSHTTNQTVNWCFYETCKNADVMREIEKEIEDKLGDRPLSEKVSAEDMKQMSYLSNVWKETLRFHPIVCGTLKEIKKTVTLKGSGIHLPKGTTVLAHTSRAMLKAESWSDPLAFRPVRWGLNGQAGEGDKAAAGSYLPFSAGQRSCPGMFLANYEGLFILVELHRRFKFELACDASEVISLTSFVERESVRWPDGVVRGIPMRVSRREWT